MKNPMRLVAVLSGSLLLSGCFSNPSHPGGEFNEVPQGGAQTFVYEGSFDQVWTAALDVMTALQASDHMNVKTRDKSKGLIYAKKPLNWVSTGENVTVWIKAVDASKCSVEVITRRVVQTKDWTAQIHQGLAAVLRRVSG
jgi:hypothetical protein